MLPTAAVPVYPRLAEPLQVGPMALRNRFVQTGHATNMAHDGLPQARLRAYYAERAAGGVAMIITEAQSVHPTALIAGSPVRMWQDGLADCYREIADELHAHDTRFVPQLWHCGFNTDSSITERAAWAPSAVAGALNHEIAHAVTVEEIADLVNAYSRGAAVARAGGADGVEIHMGHGYLPQQFLSPLSNRRTDAYGGSWENRLRFPLEVLDAVRATVGPELAVGVRISGEEGVPGGLGLPEAIAFAEVLEETGQVDYLSVSFGTYANMEIQTAPMGMPAGHLAPLAAGVRAQVALPVIAVGRMLTPEVGEALLQAGSADLIGMARELIAEPEYPAKALSGRAAEIRPCIACNYCQSRLWFRRAISCIHNPAAGRERELGRAAAALAPTARRVLVVGGGPAGMESALAAAGRGHRVTLVEGEDALGGQLRFASRPQSRREVAKVVAHRERMLDRTEVEVLLGHRADAPFIAAAAPDAVILATGSVPSIQGATGLRPDRAGIPGIASARALTSWDVLAADAAPIEGHVLIVDLEGHVQALAVADHLQRTGATVTLATPHAQVGARIGGTTWTRLMQIVSAGGARLRVGVMPERVEGEQVVLADAFGGPTTTLDDVAAIVVVGDARAQDSLRAELEELETAPEIIAVGDCVAPRHLDMAILEGQRAGRSL
jgi:2,4-dienoyl-CoA reductase-like NADH-dependent reductase (Old Yellow Enzyme family)